MALASYFSKNALAIQHILKGGSYEEFGTLLNNHVVEIAFDKNVQTHEGGCCLDMLVKLLARLYPKMRFQALEPSLDKEIQECLQLARRINSLIEIVEDPATVSVVVGSTPLQSKNAAPVFYIGSSDWTVLLSLKEPVGCGDSLLPFASGTAACVGAANVFRYVLSDLLRKKHLDSEVSFSLLEPYKKTDKPIICTDLGLFHLVGIGAIGNGCLWTLSKLKEVNGEVIAIDHQKVKPSNIQRYVQVFEKDNKIQKGIVALRSLKQTSIVVKHSFSTWNKFINTSSDYRKEVVLTALDSAKDRIAVQASLPKIIFNAYTDDGILGVARHLNFIEEACLNCMYTPKGPMPGRSERIARDLGIPEPKIREAVYLNSKVDEPLLRIIANCNHIDYKEIKKFKGMPIETFYSEFVCAGALLKIRGGGSGPTHTIEAPLAFQSALAGILLIADLFLYRAGVQLKFNRTHYNPLSAIRAGINFTHHTLAKDNSGRCICGDDVYMDVYQRKWL